MKTSNSNYQETDDGFVRREGAPDAQHKSRLNWNRLENLLEIRNSISQSRERQNQINEEYRRRRDDEG